LICSFRIQNRFEVIGAIVEEAAVVRAFLLLFVNTVILLNRFEIELPWRSFKFYIGATRCLLIRTSSPHYKSSHPALVSCQNRAADGLLGTAPSYRLVSEIAGVLLVFKILPINSAHSHGLCLSPGKELKYSHPITPPKSGYFFFNPVKTVPSTS